MARCFSAEKWPSGYSFTSRCSSGAYLLCVRLLRAGRWILIACAVRPADDPFTATQPFVSKELRVKFGCLTAAVFLGIELLGRLNVTEERLILLKGFGLQMESRSLFGKQSIRTLPISEISDMLINEAVMMDEVIFYMLITLKNSDEIVLPFENAIPRLKGLRLIHSAFNEMFPAEMRRAAAE
ncbi:Phosphatidylinositol N-acetylglucosaminyltransferase subunit H [Babesia bigemina]|uniref:Phosphatidylinositol N-acetylglucosaminyltransferase subunit H n=1 Tax=Babesia bigemina TaxID=5866 RepID=A0A061D7R7_BABBI|nr:Phosphatidylinositol N-acetylglucosaminyltransferase subunit H [Babesia bigemina]CDR93760.1 Phosphatidylinositol N-acetylglucosaminyltransferase subunit H [Babesia bigemina]|eukprot:XP_012765946.1 Phosphatidylinositol N-acetylglucosaminyltransferase subunit H [Babesia bigemina]